MLIPGVAAHHCPSLACPLKKTAIATLGGQLKDIIDVKIENSDIERKLVVIQKVSKTPEKYPRKAGIPKKRPLR